MVYLLIFLGAGLTLLFTELSIGLESINVVPVGTLMFAGACIAVLVGSHSDIHWFGVNPRILASVVYWVIVGMGVGVNIFSKE